MKKNLVLFVFIILSKILMSQQPAARIWAVSPSSNDLYAADTTNWSFPINLQPSISGSVITGMTGLAYDPTTFKPYAIIKIGSGRYLAEINLSTGTCTMIGNLGDNFASITFDEFGQLWGATGDGANNSETLYRINKANAVTTLAFAMGNGADGEVICYNRFDDKMYHWSGNTTVVMESWPITNTAYTPSNITTSGNVSNETFGAICLRANQFIVSTINAEYQYLTATGVYGNPVSTNPAGLRGIIMPPRFALSPSTVCVGTGSVNLYSNCLQLYDSVYYHWGDGNMTQLLATSSSTAASAHSYISPGTYTITVELYNGSSPKGTFTTFTVSVTNGPIVSVSGGGTICPGQSLTLSGTGAGANQWLLNGVAIPSANSNTLSVTAPGLYNLMVTGQGGCSDSASVGAYVVLAPSPTISASNATICELFSHIINPSGADTYTITGGTFTVNPSVTTTYSITGSNAFGCISSNTAVVTVVVGKVPTITVSSSKPVLCAGETATLTATGGASYNWSDGTLTNTIAISPTVTTSYVIAATGSVSCSNTVTFQQEVSNCVGLLDKSQEPTALVFPNPNKGVFYIKNVPKHSSLTVLDITGQKVYGSNIEGSSKRIDISNLSAGVYFICTELDGKTLSRTKIIKE